MHFFISRKCFTTKTTFWWSNHSSKRLFVYERRKIQTCVCYSRMHACLRGCKAATSSSSHLLQLIKIDGKLFQPTSKDITTNWSSAEEKVCSNNFHFINSLFPSIRQKNYRTTQTKVYFEKVKDIGMHELCRNRSDKQHNFCFLLFASFHRFLMTILRCMA